jgi:hypothetical protein
MHLKNSDDQGEQEKFNAQVKMMHEKYQEALEARKKIIKWQDSLQASSIPETLPMYSNERRI